MQADHTGRSDRTESSNADDRKSQAVSAGAGSSAEETARRSTGKSPSVDSFYERLSKLYESTGLSLLFNFRETSLDLQLFYKEVTERGGFHQVTKDGSWDDIASLLNSEGRVSLTPTELHKIYANLLYQFEQIYHYRTTSKRAAASDYSSYSTKKQKYVDDPKSPVVNSDMEDDSTEGNCHNKSNSVSTAGPGTPEQKLVKKTSPEYDIKKGKTAYQIFLGKECERLKKIHGKKAEKLNLRMLAIEAWRCLSESDKQPYIEESRKDRERFKREMAAYKKHMDMLAKSSENIPSGVKTDSEYHVTLQPPPENFFVPDESTVQMAFKLMKDARPSDPIFQTEWDG
ncbi:hypothetical protein NMG60_11032386 [Bertholletia excelsa]